MTKPIPLYKHASRAGAAIVAFGFITSAAVADLTTSGVSAYPNIFIEDSESPAVPVGQVVGFRGSRPLVLMTDDVGDRVLLEVRAGSLASASRVFFSNNDCTGTAYLPTFVDGTASDLADSFEELEGNAWGIGPPTGMGTIGTLYKSTGNMVAATIASAWISTNTPGNCFGSSSGNGEMKFSTTSENLDNVFTPPFKFR